MRWGAKLAGGTGRGYSALRPANGLECEVWGFGVFSEEETGPVKLGRP